MKSIIVICEGKSETKYLQELNRFLREQSDKYLKLIKENIFSDYDKSSLTNLFIFNKQTLENLFKHNAEQSEIKSDFAEFLREVFSKIN